MEKTKTTGTRAAEEGLVWSGANGGVGKSLAMTMASAPGLGLVGSMSRCRWWAWLTVFASIALLGGCAAYVSAGFKWGG